jgi:hypothetical protein
MAQLKITKVTDNTDKLISSLQGVIKRTLLVGIPSENAPREDSSVSNAMIGYVQEFGEPANNLPARPFLVPGVNMKKDEIVQRLRIAAKAAIEGDEARAQTMLDSLGLILVNSVHDVMDAQQFVPLAPSTVEARLAKLSPKERRNLEKDLGTGAITLETIASGASEYLKILEDTRSLYKAITYVIR